jgi:hypothetical protein
MEVTMRNIIGLLILLISISSLAIAQDDFKLPRVSQKSTLTQTVGLTDITINYSRPGVKGRSIWGALVPYDKVWRTGANEATTIQFSQDVKIEGKALPAGTYSLHSIPGQQEWTIIFNKDAKQWGSYSYDEAKDALRARVKPRQGEHMEWMRFAFPDVSMNAATLQLEWEKVRVPIRIETDTVNQAMASIQKALSGNVTDWQVPYSAASFVMENGLPQKDDAMKWIDQSVALKETYWNLRLKADLLAAKGNTQEAIQVAEKAVQLGKANEDEPSEIVKTEKKIADWKAGKS